MERRLRREKKIAYPAGTTCGGANKRKPSFFLWASPQGKPPRLERSPSYRAFAFTYACAAWRRWAMPGPNWRERIP
jgi:hypothetical protein